MNDARDARGFGMRRAYAALPSSLKRFIVTGLITVGIDALVYALLIWLSTPPSPAKAASFIAGTIFAYFANRFWTFEATKSSETRIVSFVLVYLTSAAINVGANKALLMLFGAWTYAYPAAWLLATCASASSNYIGMRFIAFRAKA